MGACQFHPAVRFPMQPPLLPGSFPSPFPTRPHSITLHFFFRHLYTFLPFHYCCSVVNESINMTRLLPWMTAQTKPEILLAVCYPRENFPYTDCMSFPQIPLPRALHLTPRTTAPSVPQFCMRPFSSCMQISVYVIICMHTCIRLHE